MAVLIDINDAARMLLSPSKDNELMLRLAVLALVAAVGMVMLGAGPDPTDPQVVALPVPTAAPERPPGSPQPWSPREFSVVASGDSLLHSGLWQQAHDDAGGRGYDFRPLMAGVRDVIRGADLAICHLETPLGKPGGPFTGYPIFEVPPQIAKALTHTGYDACSTASNHSIDRGEAGVRRTLDALDAAGIAHAGMARSQAEQARPTIVTVRGVRVALLSYTFSFNGMHRPHGREWLVNELDRKAVRREARRAREAGAEVIIASLHWGTEYQHDPNPQQRTLAKKLLPSPDIDLIIGHHAHVVQPFERIGTEWVAYGLGNHVSYQSFSQVTKDGVIARFQFVETEPGRFTVRRAEALPTYMRLDEGPARLLLVADCPVANRTVCAASGQRTSQVLRSRGAGKSLLKVVK